MTSNSESDPSYAIYSQILNNSKPQQDSTPVTISEESMKKISSYVAKSLEPVFIKLTSEILTLRDEVKQLKQCNTPPDVLPQKPFGNEYDFENFEQKINDASVMISLENNLKHLSNNSGRFVKNCWRKIFTDKCAEKYSWKGTTEKKSIQNLNVTMAIKNATVKRGFDEGHFIQESKSFFQFAKNRQKQRAEYKDKSIPININIIFLIF